MAKTVKITLDNKDYLRVLPDEKAVSSVREFEKTTADIASGGDGKPANGIPAKSAEKFTFNIWKNVSDGLWETIKVKGKFFIKSVIEN